MRVSAFPVVALMLLVFSFEGCALKIQAVEDLSAIKAMFLNFRTAIQQNSGEEAVAYVSKNSIERYRQFQNWAVSSSPEELGQLSVIEQIEVARLKHNFSDEQLKSMTSQEVVAGLIDNDHLDAPFVADSTLAEPVFQGNKCYIQIFDKSGAVKEKLTFIKEDDEWKVHLIALEDVHEKIYSGMMQNRDLTPEELILTIIESWESTAPAVTPDHSKN